MAIGCWRCSCGVTVAIGLRLCCACTALVGTANRHKDMVSCGLQQAQQVSGACVTLLCSQSDWQEACLPFPSPATVLSAFLAAAAFFLAFFFCDWDRAGSSWAAGSRQMGVVGDRPGSPSRLSTPALRDRPLGWSSGPMLARPASAQPGAARSPPCCLYSDSIRGFWLGDSGLQSSLAKPWLPSAAPCSFVSSTLLSCQWWPVNFIIRQTAISGCLLHMLSWSRQARDVL